MNLTKVFANNVLTVTKDDGSFLELRLHPSKRKLWESEQEALDFPITENYSFQFPEPEPEPGPAYPTVSPIEFKLLFTSTERLAIKELKTTDPVVEDFYEIIDDPRLTLVDFNLQSTRNAIQYMVTLGALTQERADEIIQGNLV